MTALEESGNLDTADVVRTPAAVYYKKHTDQVGTKLYMSPEQVSSSWDVLLIYMCKKY